MYPMWKIVVQNGTDAPETHIHPEKWQAINYAQANCGMEDGISCTITITPVQMEEVTP